MAIPIIIESGDYKGERGYLRRGDVMRVTLGGRVLMENNAFTFSLPDPNIRGLLFANESITGVGQEVRVIVNNISEGAKRTSVLTELYYDDDFLLRENIFVRVGRVGRKGDGYVFLRGSPHNYLCFIPGAYEGTGAEIRVKKIKSGQEKIKIARADLVRKVFG